PSSHLRPQATLSQPVVKHARPAPTRHAPTRHALQQLASAQPRASKARRNTTQVPSRGTLTQMACPLAPNARDDVCSQRGPPQRGKKERGRHFGGLLARFPWISRTGAAL